MKIFEISDGRCDTLEAFLCTGVMTIKTFSDEVYP
jgi:hypothetical protein